MFAFMCDFNLYCVSLSGSSCMCVCFSAANLLGLAIRLAAQFSDDRHIHAPTVEEAWWKRAPTHASSVAKIADSIARGSRRLEGGACESAPGARAVQRNSCRFCDSRLPIWKRRLRYASASRSRRPARGEGAAHLGRCVRG